MFDELSFVMPKISVIVPNYNHSLYLNQRIDSILTQTYQEYEIIILDDCSNDHSRDIIEQYRNHQKVTHIIYNEQNSGSTFKQWEKGISMATGEFIWIAESDDWCEPNLLQVLVEGIESDKDCVISYCQSLCINDNNHIMWVSQHDKLSEIIGGSDYIKRFLVKNNSIFNASMVLWKKELFPTISKDFVQYKFCGDWLFWSELAKLGKVHVSGKVLNYFRKHKSDVSGNATKSGLAILESIQVLKTMLLHNLINVQDFNTGIKRVFLDYWTQKGSLKSGLEKEIVKNFKTHLSSSTKYNRLVISSFWRQIKGKIN